MSTDRIYLRGRVRSIDVDPDRRRAVRRVTRNGNSHTISIPPEFLSAMRLLPGDQVEEIFDPEWEGFFVRVATPRMFKPVPAGPDREPNG